MLYVIGGICLSLVWFPFLRYLITTYSKSMYTSVAYIQFLGLYSEIALRWGSVGELFSAFAFFNLNLESIAFSCGGLGVNTRIVQIYLPFLYPVVCLVRIAVSYLLTVLSRTSVTMVRPLLKLGWLPRRDFSLQSLSRSYLPQWIFYLNLYWYSGARSSLQLLLCAADGEGHEYLIVEPSVTCWEGRHMGYAASALFGLCIYCVGLPGTMAYVLIYPAADIGWGIWSVRVRFGDFQCDGSDPVGSAV